MRVSPPATGPVRRRAPYVLLAVVLALGGGLVLGGLTSFAQTILPAEINSFANSAGGWTMLAFLLIWAGRARPLLAAFLGIVAFQALVEGYNVVSGWRGYFYQRPFSGLFNLIGLVAGPVVGVAASLVRYGSPRWRLLAVTPLSAVLLGEGGYGLTVVADTTSPVYWTLQVVLAVVFLIVAAVRNRPGWRWVGLASVLVVTGAAVFLVGYRAL